MRPGHLWRNTEADLIGQSAEVTLRKNILVEIDAEIARLQQARALLATIEAPKAKRGRPAKSDSVTPVVKAKVTKRRTLSTEAREKIRQAQVKRWAKAKKAAKA